MDEINSSIDANILSRDSDSECTKYIDKHSICKQNLCIHGSELLFGKSNYYDNVTDAIFLHTFETKIKCTFVYVIKNHFNPAMHLLRIKVDSSRVIDHV